MTLGHGPNVSRMSEARHRPVAAVSGAIALLVALVLGCGGCGDSDAPDRAPGLGEGRLRRRSRVRRPPRPGRARPAPVRLGAESPPDRRSRPQARGGRGRGRPDPAAAAQRRRDDPRPRATATSSSAPTTTPKDGIPGFVGANDGASGVAVVLELARSLPNPCPRPVDRDRAVRRRGGPRRARVRRRRHPRQPPVRRLRARRGKQGSPPLDAIEAMVLLDMVGDCDLRDPARGELRPRPLLSCSPTPTRTLFDGDRPGSTTTTCRSSRPGSRPST